MFIYDAYKYCIQIQYILIYKNNTVTLLLTLVSKWVTNPSY